MTINTSLLVRSITVVRLRRSMALFFVLVYIRLATTVQAETPNQFVKANGITLQYLDWGGSGPVMLLLPGLGDDVHRFDTFAPHFTDRFHVVGFSRRGQGASEKPVSEYDTNTLVEDIRGFLDAMHVERADLVGHSIAGVEMTRFAARYPERVRHLVYLDAAYDMGMAYDAALKAKLIPEATPPRSPLERINAGANETRMDYQIVRAPALAFFVINGQPGNPWYVPFELNYKGEQIRLFKQNMKHGEVVEFHDTNHFFFADPQKIETVVERIRTFLSQP